MQQIGRYQVLGELGRGGMAIVYRALDPRFDREVAVKLLPIHLTQDPQFLVRFQKEAQIIAALEHPAIVPVYDFGDHDDAPYLVLRYMVGGSLLSRLKQGPLTLQEISGIYDRLAPAIDKAHQKGVIHRDIKPGNVLFDEDRLAYLSDFGIARLVEGAQAATVIGTPAYMSPEQAEGVKKLDWRADIYSMGVMLYELLSGKQPYEAETATGQILMHVLQPVPDVRAANPDLPPAAQQIINRAMAKQRSLRYPTVSAMAADIHRLLPDDTVESAVAPPPPVLKEAPAYSYAAQPGLPDSAPAIPALAPDAEPSSPPPPRELPLRWVVLAVVLLLLASATGIFVVFGRGAGGGSGGTSIAAAQPVGEEYRPVIELVNTPTPTPSPVSMVAAMPTETLTSTPDVDLDDDGVPNSVDGCPEEAGSQDGDGCPPTPAPATSVPVEEKAPLSTAELAMISSANAVDLQPLIRLGKGRILDMTLDPAGEVIAVSSPTGVYWYDSHSLQEVAYLDIGGLARALVYTPDGERLAISSGTDVEIWDVANAKLLHTLGGHIGWVRALAVSPDGSLLAVGSNGSNSIRLWDLESGTIQQVIEGHEGQVTGLAFSPDGTALASASADGSARIWDPLTAEQRHLFEGQEGWVRDVAFSPDGLQLALAAADGTVDLWDIEGNMLLLTLDDNEGELWSVVFANDGRIAASAAGGTVHVWDGASGELLRSITGIAPGFSKVRFSPDGRTLFVLSGADNHVRAWDALRESAESEATVVGHVGPVKSVAVSPDGTMVAVGYADGIIRFWQLADGQLLDTFPAHADAVLGLDFSADGKLLASASADTTVRVWDLDAVELLQTFDGHTLPVNSVAFSSDGTLLASAGDDLTVQLWDLAQGERLRYFQGSLDAVHDVAWSHDGQFVVAGAGEWVYRWEAASGILRQRLDGHVDDVLAVAYAKGGDLIASGSADATARVWDAASGDVLQTLGGHNGPVRGVAFSADDSLLATGSGDDLIRLWELSKGRLLTDQLHHTDEVSSLAFTKDGTRLISGSEDGTVKLWGVPAP